MCWLVDFLAVPQRNGRGMMGVLQSCQVRWFTYYILLVLTVGFPVGVHGGATGTDDDGQADREPVLAADVVETGAPDEHLNKGPALPATRTPDQMKKSISTSLSSTMTGAGLPVEEMRLGLTGTDYSILRLEVSGFEKLPLEQKMLAWHLYRAVVLGNEILFHQNHPSSHILRQLLLTLWEHRSAMAVDVGNGLEEYMTCFFLNHGQYGHRGGNKYLPGYLTWPMVVHAMDAARAGGADFAFLPGIDDQSKLKWVFRNMFHPWEDAQLNESGGQVDLVTGSTTNVYGPGVTGTAIRHLPDEERNCVNCAYGVKGARQQIAGSGTGAATGSAGDVGEPEPAGAIQVDRYCEQGLLGACFGPIIRELEAARKFAGADGQVETLDHLIAHLRTGGEAEYKDFFRKWVHGRNQVDLMMGFVEPLKDPRGVVGTWQGVVWIPIGFEAGGIMAAAAPNLEKRMPWPDRYKRTDGFESTVQLVQALVGTGDMGPIPWAGFNLPNYDDIKAEHGTRRVVFINLADIWSAAEWKALVDEFWLPEYVPGAVTYGQKVRMTRVLLHEMFGHGSGQADPTLDGDPADHLGRVYAPLEEARADLVALHLMGAPELVEWGLVKKKELEDFSNYALLDYLQRAFVEQALYRESQVKGAHQMASQAILKYLVRGGRDGKGDFGVRVAKDGERGLFLKVDDFDKLRGGIARLLGLLQTYKSTGNSRAAEVLFDDLASSYEPDWQADVTSRMGKVGVAAVRGFVFPRLELVVGNDGQPVDVLLVRDQAFLEQQLGFAAESACCSCHKPVEPVSP